MKKLLTLSTALLFTAGAAFAQSNDASVSQSGDDNDASVEQIGSGNEAEFNQGFINNGDFQGQSNAIGEIIQDGNNNGATLNQRAWGDDGNEHTIDQIGSENVAKVDIYNGNNFGFVEQFGSENDARMVQSGTGHGSVIIQTGDENYARSSSVAGSGNETAVVQGIPGETMPVLDGPVNEGPQLNQPFLILPESSVGNAATMRVKGSDNMAGILQLGSYNNAGSNPQWGGDLGISIEGDGNAAGIAQLGSENTANISVLGNANTALIVQFGSGDIGSIMQDGSGNSAVITQSGMGLVGPVLE